MAGHEINLVADSTGSVILENHNVILAQPGKSLTPATVMAAAGFYANSSLRIHPNIALAVDDLNGAGGDGPSVATELEDLRDKLWASGPTGFGLILLQIQSHIAAASELRSVVDFIGNTVYSDYGSNISNIRSLSTYGIDSSLGNLSSLADAIQNTGKLFDTTDMSTFGTAASMVSQMNANKIANQTGVNQALINNNVSIENIFDPVYEETINRVLANNTDSEAINLVYDQLEVNTSSTVSSLLGFLDFRNYTRPNDNLRRTFSTVSDKLSDLGLKFDSSRELADFLRRVETINARTVSNLTANTTTLSSMVANLTPLINNMIGTSAGSGKNRLPTVRDFVEAVAGGPNITAVITGSTTSAEIARVGNMIISSKRLLVQAGIDIDQPKPTSLPSILAVATSIPEWGADTSGSNIRDVVTDMVTPNRYGEAVLAALVEGKNKELLKSHGSPTINYYGD